MNNNVMSIVSQADGDVERFAYLLIKECSQLVENLKFTHNGPSSEVMFQRMLCARAIEEHFGLVGPSPIQPLND